MALDLADRKTLRAFLGKHGLWASKGLSQHFLCSREVVGAIENRLSGISGALEIGPGPGVLTSMLCEKCDRVLAIELDSKMLPALAESAPCAEVNAGDALKVDWAGFLERFGRPRALVSNIPYAITGPILTKAAEVRMHYDKAVLMMQKEVGQRVLAQAGHSERGSLSVFLQAQFEISKVCDVPRSAFLPVPKVDSVVLEFIPNQTGVSAASERKFFAFVRNGFRMPRKTLENNVMNLAGSRETARSWLRNANIPEKARPQDLVFDQWQKLWKESEKLASTPKR
jgi:16S rRNA (adenine1518-N6/adenine1519-N6)-dimethyltransferase